MSQNDIVRFERVEKSYDGRTLAVADLTIAVRRGEFLTFLGPSGSGKTSCLLMLAGFEAPTSGKIFLDTKSLATVPPHRRDIGMVFQNYALFPHLTVGENVAFPLSVRGYSRSEIETRVTRALEMVKLPGFASRRTTAISGGQQQRVALARSLVYEPKLILLDEPLSALDKQLREEMQYELKRLHRLLGVTMIYVTHDQAEAMTMSDRIAVFDQGRVQQLAEPRTLYEAPANVFVAHFIGENNKFIGIVTAADDRSCQVRLATGKTIVATPCELLPPGSRVVVSIRPECLVLGDVAETLTNRALLRVEDVSFLGDHLRVRLSGEKDEEFLAKLSNQGEFSRLNRGDIVPIGWRPEDARAFIAGQSS